MFERPHHRRIALALQALDATVLRAHGCLFGGGTAMALRYGEYRESVDIDFLVSDPDHYRALRERLAPPQGLSAILRPGAALSQLGELRRDQYGIRTRIAVDAQPIKFEIVREARIALELPRRPTAICGIATLTPLDMLAGKLLANADRWRDAGVFSRDLIDMAMMAPARPLLQKALAKAEAAYGDEVRRSLSLAIAHLQDQPQYLQRCLQAMAMDASPADVMHRIRALARKS